MTRTRSGTAGPHRSGRVRGVAAAVFALSAALLTVGVVPAGAVSSAHPAVVDAVPSTLSPAVRDGKVQAILQVGDRVLLGGAFSQVSSAGSATTVTRNDLLAFDVATGVLDEAFLPVLDGYVETLLPGPTAGTVYVGGGFNRVDGESRKGLVLLDLATGQAVPGFRPGYMNGLVRDLAVRGGQLLVGGTFTTFAGQPRGGLASLDPSTGALTGYLNLSVTEHHNFNGTGANGAVGVMRFDVTPDGSRMVVLGNFRKVAGQTRRQIAMLDLTGPVVTLVTNWQSTRFANRCRSVSVDSYVRDVDISPDGSFFVVAAVGGYFPGTLCDTASRWEIAATGKTIEPTWVDVSGGDSILSTVVTGAAVYIGGHQRWLNNPLARDAAGPGAVPRPGIAALDPLSGVPLSWNPGRNPRGAGAEVLYATTAGLWVGSDTEYVGNFRYLRPRVAFFPLTQTVPPDLSRRQLPADVYLGGPLDGAVGAPVSDGGTATADGLTSVFFNGSSVSPRQRGTDAAMNWADVRGAFVLGPTLFYGTVDGSFHKRSFDGVSFGPVTNIDPYNDAAWATVKTGKTGGQTYRGLAPDFYAQLSQITGLSAVDGWLYYTVSGDPALHRRAWSAESGVIAPEQSLVVGSPVGEVRGLFFSGTDLYTVSAADGSLTRRSFTGSVVGSAASVLSGPAIDGIDWRAHAVFLGPGRATA